MRLQAAISLLHLSTIKTFATAISTKFLRLACVIQVRVFEHYNGLSFSDRGKIGLLLRSSTIFPYEIVNSAATPKTTALLQSRPISDCY